MWLWRLICVFRFRYWVVYSRYPATTGAKFLVVRGRLSPDSIDYILVDGPFDYQEDAARALAFWRHQTTVRNRQ